MASFTSVIITKASGSHSDTMVFKMRTSLTVMMSSTTGRSRRVQAPRASSSVQPRSISLKICCSISAYASETMNAARWRLPPSTTASITKPDSTMDSPA